MLLDILVDVIFKEKGAWVRRLGNTRRIAAGQRFKKWQLKVKQGAGYEQTNKTKDYHHHAQHRNFKGGQFWQSLQRFSLRGFLLGAGAISCCDRCEGFNG